MEYKHSKQLRFSVTLNKSEVLRIMSVFRDAAVELAPDCDRVKPGYVIEAKYGEQHVKYTDEEEVRLQLSPTVTLNSFNVFILFNPYSAFHKLPPSFSLYASVSARDSELYITSTAESDVLAQELLLRVEELLSGNSVEKPEEAHTPESNGDGHNKFNKIMKFWTIAGVIIAALGVMSMIILWAVDRFAPK